MTETSFCETGAEEGTTEAARATTKEEEGVVVEEVEAETAETAKAPTATTPTTKAAAEAPFSTASPWSRSRRFWR